MSRGALTTDEQQLLRMFTARGVVADSAPSRGAPAELWDAFFVRLFGACHDIARELAEAALITGPLWDESGPALLRAWWLATSQPLLEQWEAFILRSLPTP
jgi:hypothetical protein